LTTTYDASAVGIANVTVTGCAALVALPQFSRFLRVCVTLALVVVDPAVGVTRA